MPCFCSFYRCKQQQLTCMSSCTTSPTPPLLQLTWVCSTLTGQRCCSHFDLPTLLLRLLSPLCSLSGPACRQALLFAHLQQPVVAVGSGPTGVPSVLCSPCCEHVCCARTGCCVYVVIDARAKGLVQLTTGSCAALLPASRHLSDCVVLSAVLLTAAGGPQPT